MDTQTFAPPTSAIEAKNFMAPGQLTGYNAPAQQQTSTPPTDTNGQGVQKAGSVQPPQTNGNGNVPMSPAQTPAAGQQQNGVSGIGMCTQANMLRFRFM